MTRRPLPLEPVGDGSAPVVVDDDDRARRLGDEPLLDPGVAVEGAVAVEVVGRDVEENADRRVDARRKVDLERRALDDVEATRPRRVEREDRGADIAAELNVAIRLLEKMRDQRRRRRLAVGAGDRDERRRRHMGPPLAAEQLDVADHLDAGRLGRSTVQCGSGWVSGTPGVSTSAAKPRQSTRARSPIGMPADGRRGDARPACRPRRHQRAAGDERCRRRPAAAAEAEDRDALAGEGGDRDHRPLT